MDSLFEPPCESSEIFAALYQHLVSVSQEFGSFYLRGMGQVASQEVVLPKSMSANAYLPLLCSNATAFTMTSQAVTRLVTAAT